MKYIILDTETTGIAEDDRIIQLAYLVVDENGQIEIEETLCYTMQPIGFKAMSIHHIVPEQLEGKEKLVNTPEYKRLLELNTPDNYLVIQNAKFDLPMLEKEGFKNQMRLIDTLILARHLLPESEGHGEQFLRYSLGLYRQEQAILNSLGIKEIAAHDAVGDILVLWLLFQYLRNMEDLYARIKAIPIFDKELDNIGIDFANFQEYNLDDQLFILTQIPRLKMTFPFGKHKDRNIANVIQNDPSYVNWVLNKMDTLQDDIRFSIEYFLYPEQGSGINYILPEMMNEVTAGKIDTTENKEKKSDDQLSLFDLM